MQCRYFFDEFELIQNFLGEVYRDLSDIQIIKNMLNIHNVCILNMLDIHNSIWTLTIK